VPYLKEGASMGDVVNHDIEVLRLYGNCQIKLQALQNWVKSNKT